jgi:hypothetical protein
MTGTQGDSGLRLPPVTVWAGPHQGTWRHYRPRPTSSRPRLGTCARCHQWTADVGAAGWVFHRREWWRSGRQLCPTCLAAVLPT